MIRYTLICDNAHEFESWFASSGSFDDQASLACAMQAADAALYRGKHAGRNRVEREVPGPGCATDTARTCVPAQLAAAASPS